VPKTSSEYDVAALGAKRHAYRVGQCIDAVQILSRASTENFTSLADISVFPVVRPHLEERPTGTTPPRSWWETVQPRCCNQTQPLGQHRTCLVAKAESAALVWILLPPVGGSGSDLPARWIRSITSAGEMTETRGVLEVPVAHRPAATLSNVKGKREAPSLPANVTCPHSSQTNRSEPTICASGISWA
jgi:hypothetical protein